MQIQITCPQCRTPFPAQIFQLIDAQRQPELKQMLLAGALNVAACPTCGANSQVAAPLLYHDAAHELLMVHIPMDLNLPLPEQEKLIGQLTKAITDSTPPEQFRAYMLQPEIIMTMKTFMEKVYATEGITPEMLARQRQQIELLQQLAMADKEQSLTLIGENEALIDEAFFAILHNALQAAEQAPNGEQDSIRLINLRARLFTSTAVGRQLEKRQVALHGFQQEAKAQNGLSYALFAKHLLANMADENTVEALIQMGQQALGYELFTHITAALEAAQQEGQAERAAQITQLREKLLALYEEIQKASKEMQERAQATLTTLLEAADPAQAVQQNLHQIDEFFMHYLSTRLAEAGQRGDTAQQVALKNIQTYILQAAESQMPPELQLLNRLVQTEDEAAQREMIRALPPESRSSLVEILQVMRERATAEGNEETAIRVDKLQRLLAVATS